MSLLLALDTSGATVTVAVCDLGSGTSPSVRVLAEDTEDLRNQHAERLAPLVERALARAGAHPRELESIGVGVGPGPFTGLRVGLVTAEVLGLALGAVRGRPVPVYGVCSLDALALQAVEAGIDQAEFLVATDARRREVYWAAYRRDGDRAVRTRGPDVDAPAQVGADRAGRPVIGRGATLYPEALGIVSPTWPLDVRAAAVGRLAAGAHAAGEQPDVRPLYLRRPDAAVPGERKRVSTS